MPDFTCPHCRNRLSVDLALPVVPWLRKWLPWACVVAALLLGTMLGWWSKGHSPGTTGWAASNLFREVQNHPFWKKPLGNDQAEKIIAKVMTAKRNESFWVRQDGSIGEWVNAPLIFVDMTRLTKHPSRGESLKLLKDNLDQEHFGLKEPPAPDIDDFIKKITNGKVK